MNTDTLTFAVEVEETSLRCPTGDRYAEQRMHEGSIPVLSCEGPCIRGEIARQAANRIGKQPPFARACQGEVLTVPQSGMARWVRDSEQVVVLDGCYLRCQARQMRRMLRPGQLIEIDTMGLYKKYSDLFAIDDVPEAERNTVADDVAQQVLAKLTAEIRP